MFARSIRQTQSSLTLLLVSVFVAAESELDQLAKGGVLWMQDDVCPS